MMAVTSWAQMADSLALQEVVVTGTRNATDVRHLPMTVNVIGRQQLTEQHQTSVLPTVMQQVPGIFVTSRSMLGYGVSTGAAGGINLRGISGGDLRSLQSGAATCVSPHSPGWYHLRAPLAGHPCRSL